MAEIQMKNNQDVVVVTGGAYGIGRAVVEQFCEKKAAVAIGDLNSERGSALQLTLEEAGHETFFLRTDVRSEGSVQKLICETVKRWGRLNVLCNNAGIERYRALEEYSLQDWDDIINTNLRGAFLCSKFALPHLRRAKGCIVNIGSVQALACERNISIYAASKAGLLALTRGLALDYAADGVRVNAVCPGAINTGMMEAALATSTDREAVVAELNRGIPLGRIGEPVDIARVVCFLASREASYMTGSTLVVDGGILAKLAI